MPAVTHGEIEIDGTVTLDRTSCDNLSRNHALRRHPECAGYSDNGCHQRQIFRRKWGMSPASNTSPAQQQGMARYQPDIS